jgi:hypothetical protein
MQNNFFFANCSKARWDDWLCDYFLLRSVLNRRMNRFIFEFPADKALCKEIYYCRVPSPNKSAHVT